MVNDDQMALLTVRAAAHVAARQTAQKSLRRFELRLRRSRCIECGPARASWVALLRLAVSP